MDQSTSDSGPREAAGTNEATCATAAQRLEWVLRQTGAFLEALPSDDCYATTSDGWGGTIGAHVRHCWDHVAALLSGLERGVIAYDDRRRGTAIERDRALAVEQLHGLVAELSTAAALPLAHPLMVDVMLASDEAPRSLPSTLGRELGFILSHTIHHQAMMAMIAARRGIAAPEGFGYAPATVAYLQGGSCAR